MLEQRPPGWSEELFRLMKAFADWANSEPQHHRNEGARLRVLNHADWMLDGHGVEALEEGEERLADYVNMGDTYKCTFLWDARARRFDLTDWGTLVEAYEAERSQAGDRRCGWCGAWTDHDDLPADDRCGECGKSFGATLESL